MSIWRSKTSRRLLKPLRRTTVYRGWTSGTRPCSCASRNRSTTTPTCVEASRYTCHLVTKSNIFSNLLQNIILIHHNSVVRFNFFCLRAYCESISKPSLLSKNFPDFFGLSSLFVALYRLDHQASSKPLRYQLTA